MIIPSHNRYETLNTAIRSVVCQSYKNYEIIVVDDFSIDAERVEKIVASWSDKAKITLVKNNTNLNGAISRNIGAKKSKGKYLAFLDSDDFWTPNKLKKIEEAISEDFPDLIYSKFKRQGLGSGIYPERPMSQNEKIADYLISSGQSIQTSTMIIRRDLFLRVLFNDLKRFQDTDLILNLFNCFDLKTKFINQVLVIQGAPTGQRISLISDMNLINDFLKLNQNLLTRNATATFLLSKALPICIETGDRVQAISLLLNNMFYVKFGILVRSIIKIITPKKLLILIRAFRIELSQRANH